jgi:hypothetical protein
MDDDKIYTIKVSCTNPDCRYRGVQRAETYMAGKKMFCPVCGQTINPTQEQIRNVVKQISDVTNK